jgi:uncharacterized damage-inducible protein DinB
MPNRTLQDLLRGRGAHVDPVACTEGLNTELAGRRLPGAEHTIWHLVWHMNYWMEYELRSLDGPELPYPAHAAESWPGESAPASEAVWLAEVARFRRQVDQLAAWARRAGLEAIGARIVHRERGETIQEVLWQMAAHNSYHTGQMALLRRAFGAWPPTGGGDTW